MKFESIILALHGIALPFQTGCVLILAAAMLCLADAFTVERK